MRTVHKAHGGPRGGDMANEGQVSRIFGNVGELKKAFSGEKISTAIRESVPTSMAPYLTPERVLRIMTVACNRNPELLKCDKHSLITAVMDAVQLGLEPAGPLGHAYLIPFLNRKAGIIECTLLIGYKGFIDLARRSGDFESVFVQVIFHRDEYSIDYGDSPRVMHRPYIPDPTRVNAPQDRGEPVAAYCVAKFKSGGSHIEVMTVGDIEKIRSRSKAATRGPWVTDWEMMARKTVIRRAHHYWPLSAEMAGALDVDTRGVVALEDALGEARATELADVSRTEKLRRELTGEQAKQAHAKGVREAEAASATAQATATGPEAQGDEAHDHGPPPMSDEEQAEAEQVAAESQGTMEGAGF